MLEEKFTLNKRLSFLERAKEFLKNKKTQLLGATIIAGSMAIAGCATTGGLEKRVYTQDYFYPGRLVTITGEVAEIYPPASVQDVLYTINKKQLQDPNKKEPVSNKKEETTSALDVPLIVYNSIDNEGKNIVVNLHEDFRFGINRQALERAKAALGSHNYVVRAYGNMTYNSEILNVDVDFLSFTDKDGKLALTVETDFDPIITVAGITSWPINPNPNLSFGLMPHWNWNWPCFGCCGFNIGFLADWISWSWAWMDWDRDGIINQFDSYPYDNYTTGQPIRPKMPNPDFHNVYAGLNLHNALSLKEEKQKLVIPEEGARLHPAFVGLFAKNQKAENYAQQIREKIIKDYQANPNEANIHLKGRELESVGRRMGIGREQLNKSYNTGRILAFDRNGGVYRVGSGGVVSSGGSVTSATGGYSIPSAGITSMRGDAGAGSSGERSSGDKAGGAEKK